MITSKITISLARIIFWSIIGIKVLTLITSFKSSGKIASPLIFSFILLAIDQKIVNRLTNIIENQYLVCIKYTSINTTYKKIAVKTIVPVSCASKKVIALQLVLFNTLIFK
ncbi:hypothetical protein LABF186_10010 [Lactobacillus amylovorus subsp. animalium]|uniref:Uncharacterized protein n=1 Tax=Lactobacillus amylovorus subsp. animalium TaxID=3378536 RepID=A0ABD0C3M4_LACAM|nr:hypothetical protein LABF186_10010 [Lactobacillus amylovorus]GMM15717.1 hypothetical protein LABF125_08500 [Lactobacillus amylovorus]